MEVAYWSKTDAESFETCFKRGSLGQGCPMTTRDAKKIQRFIWPLTSKIQFKFSLLRNLETTTATPFQVVGQQGLD